MKRQTKQFEKQYLKVRDSIERKGVSMAKKMITEHYKYFIEQLKTLGFTRYNDIKIPEKITERFFHVYYPMSAQLAYMTYDNLEKQAGQKAEKDPKKPILTSVFQNRLTEIVNTTAGEKIVTITHTSEETIKNIIRGVLDEADTEGWGIPETTSNIYRQVGANLRGNGYSRAKAIAQTEIISASNQASQAAAEATGYNTLKFWSTSGLTNIRPTHIEAEQYSNQRDGLRMDERFPNGLLYPGDPAGSAEEVCNCRCTCLFEIVM